MKPESVKVLNDQIEQKLKSLKYFEDRLDKWEGNAEDFLLKSLETRHYNTEEELNHLFYILLLEEPQVFKEKWSSIYDKMQEEKDKNLVMEKE